MLLIACCALVWEIKRGRTHLHDMRNELAAVYGQRDTLALKLVKVRAVAESKGIVVDLSDVDRLLPAVTT